MDADDCTRELFPDDDAAAAYFGQADDDAAAYRRPRGKCLLDASLQEENAMYFLRTAPAVQRCKNQQRRRSYGRDRRPQGTTPTPTTSRRR